MEASTPRQWLSPSQAAAESGVAAETLRYWERAGLLAPIGRDAGGRRRYLRTDLEFLDVVRCLRVTGMPIRMVRRFTDLLQANHDSLDERIALLAEHREHVLAGIHAQQAALAVIEQKIRAQQNALEARS